MPSQLTVGVNSYGTLAEADTYLDDSARGGDWLGFSSDDKTRFMISAFRLIDKQSYAGSASGVSVVTTIAINAAGTGYVVGDVLSSAAGTFGEALLAQVTAIGGSGEVTALALIDGGTYTVAPSNPATMTGGTGSGCTLDLTLTNQTALFPRTGLTDCDDQDLDSYTLPERLVFAQIELAYSISLDSDVETEASTGTNVKKVGAGSASVEFFRPFTGTRFPSIVQEYLRCLYEVGSAISGPTITGTSQPSSFCPDDFGLNSGLS